MGIRDTVVRIIRSGVIIFIIGIRVKLRVVSFLSLVASSIMRIDSISFRGFTYSQTTQ